MALKVCLLTALSLSHVTRASILEVRQSVSCNFQTSPDFEDTCAIFSDSWGLTVQELIELNPEIRCPDIDNSQLYCVSGTVSKPSSSFFSSPTTTTFLQTSSSATSPTPTTPQPASTTIHTSPTSSLVTTIYPHRHQPQQSGTALNCNQFYLVAKGDSCPFIEAKFGITITQFTTWNPSLNRACNNLIAEYYYCVSVPGTATKPSPTKGTGSNQVTTPIPVQPGMTGDCNSFPAMASHVSAATILWKYRITTMELYSWNKAIDTSCRNLQADYYVCVDVIGRLPSPPSTSTNNGIATPTPVQQNMITYCAKFHEVVPGDYCALVAQKYSITSSQIIKWNPDVGTECGSLLVGYQVCVGTL